MMVIRLPRYIVIYTRKWERKLEGLKANQNGRLCVKAWSHAEHSR